MDSQIYTHKDGRKELHPLFNELIFRSILPCLDVADLRESRLVCKSWSSFITPDLQERSCVKIRLFERGKFSDFLKFLSKTPTLFLYQNFKFTRSTFTLPLLFNDFLLRCGPMIKSLCCIQSVLSVAEFRSILLSASSTRLESLEFQSCYFSKLDSNDGDTTSKELPIFHNFKSFSFMNTYDSEDVFPFTWNEFFTSFPSLSEFNAEDFNEEMNASWLQSCQEMKPRLNIRKLNVFGHTRISAQFIHHKQWQQLHGLNLKLRSLQIDPAYVLNEKEFGKILKQQAPTLHELRIWRGVLADNVHVFPHGVPFPKLEILEVSENCITNLTFLNCTRQLKRLWIRQCDNDPFEKSTTILSDINHVKPLISLQFFAVDSYASDSELQNIKIIFPNASKIKYFKKLIDDQDLESLSEEDN